ncbi:MAG: retropepsin-like aspartic protease [Pseudomonadota bacterium]
MRLGQGRWTGTKAFLDSGAHTSIFNARTMKRLGVSPSVGKIASMRDGSGRVFRCRRRKIEVKVGNLILPLNAAFSEEFNMGFNILGMDFFSQTVITFDIPNKRILIRKEGQGRPADPMC